MPLTSEQVEHVAQLARLSLDADEVERFRAQLSRILGYLDKVEGLDVSGVPPTVHAVDVQTTPLRSDVVQGSLPSEVAVSNAPEREGTLFLVPRIIE